MSLLFMLRVSQSFCIKEKGSIPSVKPSKLSVQHRIIKASRPVKVWLLAMLLTVAASMGLTACLDVFLKQQVWFSYEQIMAFLQTLAFITGSVFVMIYIISDALQDQLGNTNVASRPPSL